MKAFLGLLFYIHPKKGQLNQCLINNLIAKLISFFESLLFQQLFSDSDKMWKVNGFLYQLFPCAVPGGQTVWKCITEAQSEMLPGWRQNQPGVWRANSVLTLAHSIKATISEPFDICHGHTFQGRIWPSARMWSGNCYTMCKEHSWQKDLFYSFGQLQKRESCCPCVKLGSTMCSSQNFTQIPKQDLPRILDFSFMMRMMQTIWPSVPTNK